MVAWFADLGRRLSGLGAGRRGLHLADGRLLYLAGEEPDVAMLSRLPPATGTARRLIQPMLRDAAGRPLGPADAAGLGLADCRLLLGAIVDRHGWLLGLPVLPAAALADLRRGIADAGDEAALDAAAGRFVAAWLAREQALLAALAGPAGTLAA